MIRAFARLVAALSLVTSAWPASAQPIAEQTEAVVANDGTVFDVTSAVVRVPESRAKTGPGATIDLAVVRARREGASGRTAHLLLAGGPGDSGVGLVLGAVKQGGAALAALFDGDVIGIDQRGTGRSTPNLSVDVRYNLPQDRAGSPEAWMASIAPIVQAVRDDLEQRGIDLAAYNTRESADDIAAVLSALGYDRVVLWGRSYGSHLALATLRRHPALVDRMILIGPEGPDHTWKLPGQVDAAIVRFAASIDQIDLPALMRGVIAQLASAPATITATHPVTKQPVEVTIGAFDLQWVTAQALGDPRALATLPAAYRRMATGDFSGIAPVVLAFRSRPGVESAMKHAMDLSSGSSAQRRARIEREASSAILGNAMNFPGMYLSGAWGVAPLDDAFREPVRSAVPTLILAGDLDPRTPIENGREIVSTLENGHLVVVENATHQFDVFGSPAIRDLLARFLTGAPIDVTHVTPR